MRITLAEAAQRLGIANSTVRTMVAAGRIPQVAGTVPIEVMAEDVDRVRSRRRAEALRRHPDLARFAQEIRRTLWPVEAAGNDSVELIDGRVHQRHTVPWTPNGPASGVRAMPFLPADAMALFGRDVIEVAAAPAKAFSGTCRWCFADAAARVHATFRPQNTPAYRVLLGEPCARDRERFAAEATAARAQLQALKAKVDRQTVARRQESARAEYDAAQRGASGAALRLRQATEALVRVDPSSAATVASGAPQAQRRSRLNCPCTAETLCADHARQFAPRGRR